MHPGSSIRDAMNGRSSKVHFDDDDQIHDNKFALKIGPVSNTEKEFVKWRTEKKQLEELTKRMSIEMS